MMSNRELVSFYLTFKLSQRDCILSGAPEVTEGGQQSLAHANASPLRHQRSPPTAGLDEAKEARTRLSEGPDGIDGGQLRVTHTEASPLRHQRSPPTAGLDEVKEALRDSANELELRYGRAFDDLHTELDLTAASTYQRFASVMDEMFRSGINWGRVVALFAFGGALCVECVEQDKSELVDRISEWMTVYLDEHIQPWITSHGGWEGFADLYGHDAAAESRRSVERFSKWMLVGMTLVTGVVLGALVVQKT